MCKIRLSKRNLSAMIQSCFSYFNAHNSIIDPRNDPECNWTIATSMDIVFGVNLHYCLEILLRIFIVDSSRKETIKLARTHKLLNLYNEVDPIYIKKIEYYLMKHKREQRGIILEKRTRHGVVDAVVVWEYPFLKSLCEIWDREIDPIGNRYAYEQEIKIGAGDRTRKAVKELIEAIYNSSFFSSMCENSGIKKRRLEHYTRNIEKGEDNK